ncbi:MAG: hypothetical protein R2712_22715 [Vicinamibacterales bacterium]
MRVILATGLVLAVSAAASAQTLYVNGSTGNDSIARSQNSASNPWRTIGRAVWGSTNRSSPNANEAARAGDTVQVAGGVYSYTGSVNDRFSVVYSTVNQGSANNYITISCVGTCTLTAPNANSPVIGASGRDYVKWFANVAQGHAWVIQACGRLSGCGANVVNTTADTGPVVCHYNTGCWVEGAVIDGGAGIDYRDNWNAVRIENCTSCVIRNNSMANFTRDQVAGDTNHNQSIITMYGTRNSIIEHNVGSNAGAGVYFKDTDTTNPQSGNIVRFNRFDRVNEVIAFSIVNENRNYVYQNVGTNGRIGLAVVNGGLSNDWVFNNTFYRMSIAATTPNGSGSGGRFWNNICVECQAVIMTSGGSMPSDNVFDMEHNVYYSYSQFYLGGDGTRSFASFRSAYPDQEQTSPASMDGNPLFVNAAGGDFRLCTGAGTPAASCSGASPAMGRAMDLYDLDHDGSTTDTVRSGAYIDNTEVIGITSPLPPAPTGLRVVVSGQ